MTRRYRAGRLVGVVVAVALVLVPTAPAGAVDVCPSWFPLCHGSGGSSPAPWSDTSAGYVAWLTAAAPTHLMRFDTLEPHTTPPALPDEWFVDRYSPGEIVTTANRGYFGGSGGNMVVQADPLIGTVGKSTQYHGDDLLVGSTSSGGGSWDYGELSIVVSVAPTALRDAVIVGRWAVDGASGWSLETTSTGRVCYRTKRVAASSVASLCSDAGAITSGRVFRLGVSHQAGGGDVKLYLDGVQVAGAFLSALETGRGGYVTYGGRYPVGTEPFDFESTGATALTDGLTGSTVPLDGTVASTLQEWSASDFLARFPAGAGVSAGVYTEWVNAYATLAGANGDVQASVSFQTQDGGADRGAGQAARLIFRSVDNTELYFDVKCGTAGFAAILKSIASVNTAVASGPAPSCGATHVLKVTFSGGAYQGFIDGVSVVTYNESAGATGVPLTGATVGFGLYHNHDSSAGGLYLGGFSAHSDSASPIDTFVGRLDDVVITDHVLPAEAFEQHNAVTLPGTVYNGSVDSTIPPLPTTVAPAPGETTDGNLADRILGGISWLGGAITSPLRSIWRVLVDGFDFLGGKLDGVVSWLRNGFQAVVDAVQALPGAILDGIQTLFVPTGNSWGSVRDGYNDGIGTLVNHPIAVLQASWSALGGGDLSDCAGPLIHIPGGPGWDGFDIQPLRACEGPPKTAADMIRPVLTAMIWLGAVLGSLRLVGGAFGIDMFGRGGNSS